MSISIHALHEEGDTGLGGQIVVDALFLSTPSMRRATYKTLGVDAGKIISIHALHEEGDCNVSAEELQG